MQRTTDKDFVIVSTSLGKALDQPQNLPGWLARKGTAAGIWLSILGCRGSIKLHRRELGDEARFDKHARLQVDTVAAAVHGVVS